MFNSTQKLNLSSFDFDNKFDNKTIKEVLKTYVDVYDEKDEKQTWFEKIKGVCAKLNFAENMKEYKQNPENFKGNVADVSGIIRVAITTKRNTPDLYELMKLLGKKEVVERINSIVEKL